MIKVCGGIKLVSGVMEIVTAPKRLLFGVIKFFVIAIVLFILIKLIAKFITKRKAAKREKRHQEMLDRQIQQAALGHGDSVIENDAGGNSRLRNMDSF